MHTPKLLTTEKTKYLQVAETLLTLKLQSGE
jgi:hypothetical protein